MKTFRTLVTILILGIVLSACGGGNTDSVDDTPSDSQRFTFGGSVGDGPITGATITLKNAADLLLATTVSDQQANYSFDISIQPSDFPLTIEATGGIDLVTGDTPDLTLFSIVPNLSANRANLNPHSTLIVEIAKVMPSGLTDVNLAAAKSTVLTKMNFGLDTSQASDPINVLIEENSVANIIKTSETLAEMIRRTRDALVLLGTDFSTDRVMHILAADLTDGSLDGNGASDSDPRLAAIANLVTGQVAIEAMSNELQVNGADATNAMDNAIQVILPITTQTTANVLINREIIIQAQRAVAAAQVVDSNPDLIALSTALANLPSNTTASTVTTLLPNGAGISLDQSISMAVTSTDNELTAINSAANSVNSPPGISGTPLLTGAENSAYSFTPSASDPDGDNLTFSVSGIPLWASFNTSTGTLSGTPGFDDAGSYSNIIISVSDGAVT
ncbi:MAG: putative Ig domain-containing protein, partial [gamma proteobacterium endosymbiont of Lamellibrachia anaximandri]|nr:putative Ig domain-containing protein [gamma proteobacterium endosymbiont of Lamellibrachia anaximandri]